MTNEEMIRTYESILTVTEQMLQAARIEDWDLLIQREHACRQLVQTLLETTVEAQTGLAPQLRQRKVEIIRKVLAGDAEIRNLMQPDMQRLQHLLSSVNCERRLHAAYGDGATD